VPSIAAIMPYTKMARIAAVMSCPVLTVAIDHVKCIKPSYPVCKHFLPGTLGRSKPADRRD
jgi:hypothetical protein